MILAVFRVSGDRAWLADARDALAATHAHWVAPPHLLPSIGLSRYFDHGEGPAPEVVASERDLHGESHYDRVRASFRAANDPAFDRYYDRAHDALTPSSTRAIGPCASRASIPPHASARSAPRPPAWRPFA